MYICTSEDFHTYSQDTNPDSDDSDVIITSRTDAEFNAAETLLWDPVMNSTTDNVGKADMGSTSPMLLPEKTPGTSKQRESECYSKYTEVYAPVVVIDEEDLLSDEEVCEPSDDKPEEPSLTEHFRLTAKLSVTLIYAVLISGLEL